MPKSLDVLMKGLEELRKIDPEMPIQRAHVFLTIVKHPNCTMREIADWTGIAQSSVVRNIQKLGHTDRTGKPGHQLIRSVPDPEYPVRHIITLTTQGMRIARSLESLL